MRRTVIAVLAVLSLVAGAVTAQTEHKTQSPASIRSDSGIKTSDGKSHLKGNVRIVLAGGIVVTADQAVYDESSRQVELVGHVRLQFAPPPSQGPQQ
jgi:lipopolysaccharide assembly outer membrane protein LptD (OstA)